MGLVVTSSDVKWNAVNLPIIYKITNTKFPVNTDDAEDSISSVANNSGFSQITLSSTAFTYQVKGKVKITGTKNYNGVWKIRSKISSTVFTIDAPFVADETGTLQNYYDNYNTLVRVYAGLPEYHPGNTDKPMTLITDNPITIKPNSSNEAIIDVSALVKSKMSLENYYDTQNDLNPFTAFYIEYSEQYDESDGVDVNVITESYQTDLVDDCEPGAANFITNGDFSTDLSGWGNIGSGIDWVQNSGEALSTLNTASRNSKALAQSGIGLTDGTEYSISMDYIFPVGEDILLTVVLGEDVILQESLTGSGTLSFRAIFEDSSVGSFLLFRVSLISSPSTSQEARIDNITILNSLTNPCINYRFAVHNALQPQNGNGGNLTEYVQSFGSVTGSKWLTLFEQPVLFEGNYFDISSLIPQSVIQSAIQSGGYFLEIVEYNRNGTVIAENQIPITENLGDGVYRFRLDDHEFDSSTKKFTVQILRIPVNLFVDGDQGTFDTTSDSAGNPPSDWNLEKDARSVINFEDTIIQSGTGALSFQSRSIFNDDYALMTFESTSPVITGQGFVCDINDVSSVDLNNDFIIEFRFFVSNSSGVNIFLASGSGGLIRFLFSSNDRILAQFDTNLGRTGLISNNDVAPLNQWTHVVLTHEVGVGMRMFINNDKTEKTTDFTPINLNPPEKVQFYGRADNNSVTHEGNYIRGVRIYQGVSATDSEANDLYGGSGKVIQSVPLSLQPFLSNEYLLNQESGMNVFNSDTNLFDAELNVSDSSNSYDLDQVRFGGGAWVDVSGI